MIAAVIPVKRLTEGKSRLSPRLSPQERADLVVALLDRTVDTLRGVRAIGRIAVAGEERELAARLGVEPLPDAGELNASLARATGWAERAGAGALLILPCDLPLLRTEDIRFLLAAALEPPSVTIAPTRDGGTGALLLCPPSVIPPAFGPGSFGRHVEGARRAGIPVRTVLRPALARDLDTPDDLDELALCLPQYGRAQT